MENSRIWLGSLILQCWITIWTYTGWNTMRISTTIPRAHNGLNCSSVQVLFFFFWWACETEIWIQGFAVQVLLLLLLFVFLVLGLELRAYTLSHSTSPLLWWAFSR
jgi:hypothetical protein